MMYIGVLILVIVVLGLIGYGIYSLSKSKVTSGDTTIVGSSDTVGKKTIDADKFHFVTNDNTSSIEIIKDGTDKPLWTSDTPGGTEVTWLIQKDGTFVIYHLNSEKIWKSVKVSKIKDNSITGELNGPYKYKFTNDGTFSVLNKDDKEVWNTKTGELVIDTTKTINPTVKTSFAVTNTNTNNVKISVVT